MVLFSVERSLSLESGHKTYQVLGIFVYWICENLLCLPMFHDLAHDGHVMTNEQHRKVQSFLKIFKQV